MVEQSRSRTLYDANMRCPSFMAETAATSRFSPRVPANLPRLRHDTGKREKAHGLAVTVYG
jgi:hypothetical protein